MTPARLGVLLAVTWAHTSILQGEMFAAAGFSWESVEAALWPHWLRGFLAGLPLFILLVKADLLAAGATARVRLGWLAAAVVAGALVAGVGAAFGLTWRDGPLPRMLATNVYSSLLLGSVFAAVLFFARNERDAARRLHEERLGRIAAQRHHAEARLQVLHAQIEPHFLFNSLASVKRLYERGPEDGRALIANLARCLRLATAGGEKPLQSLEHEVEAVRGLLEVLRLRMGDRLRYEVRVEPGVEQAQVPPLVLATLVENAVKHGVAPRASGGAVRVHARRSSDLLLLEVADDGVGMRAEAGTGVGLANSRARLASLYGDHARLDLSRNVSGGVTALVTLPLAMAPPAPGGPLSPEKGAGAAAVAGERESFLTRAWRILTWKHVAWAVALGVALPAVKRPVRMINSGIEVLGQLWLYETLMAVACAFLFLAAIVCVEASSGGRVARLSGRFALGAVAAGAACIALAWAFPPTLTPARHLTAEQQESVRAALVPSFVRRMALFDPGAYLAFEGCLATALYAWLRSARLAAAALAAAEFARAEADRRAGEARLDATRAEVDPARVFEALDEIAEMYETDRAQADATLDELIAFLRAAIPRVRGAGSEAVARTAAGAET